MDYFSGYNTITFSCISAGIRKKSESYCWGPGMRDTFTIIYITGGKGIFTSDGVSREISVGQSCIIFPYENVTVIANEQDPWEYVWIEFKGTDASWLISQTAFTKSNPVLETMPVENFEKYFDVIYGNNIKMFEKCRTNANVFILLSYYIEYFPRKIKNGNDYASAARSYIEKNFRNSECTPKKVTDHVKIDRTYLYRLFKRETGMSVQDYINKCRIDKASIMLSEENISIKDVAYSVGFSDQMYFSKVFKKLKGQTPTQYRQSLNKKKISDSLTKELAKFNIQF